MNVLYCLESVADSSIQWGAVGEYFSLENSYNKVIKFQSDESWLCINIRTNMEKCRYFRTALDSLNVYLIKYSLLMKIDCDSFVWTCFII